MDFLDNHILPQSAHHIVLLRYLLILTLVILVPYLSFITGASLISLFLRKKGPEAGEGKYYKLAKDFADLAAFNKSLPLALGVVPMLSAVFCYAQLLHLSSSNVPGYLLLSLVLFLVAAGLLSLYKHSFHFTDLFTYLGKEEIKSEEYKKEIASYKSSMGGMFTSTGFYGVLFLLAATYVFIGAIQLASQTDKVATSSDFLLLFFSFDTITYYVQFLFLALTLASLVMLYYYFRPSSEQKENVSAEYGEYVKKFSLSTGLISMLVIPLFLVANLISKSDVALTGSIFFVAIFVFFLLVMVSNLFYLMLRNNHTKYITSATFLMVLFLILFVMKDQFAFNTATKDQYFQLVKNYEVKHAEFLAEFGLGGEVISGADIYNGRCIACHQFDKKVVGPPYNETLPKYEGDADKLANFILNPVKINPEYPAMPNQGLKPAEAKAVAEYILQTYQPAAK